MARATYRAAMAQGRRDAWDVTQRREEARLAPAGGNVDPGREGTADRLGRAILWREVSAVAARVTDELVRYYRFEEGLIVDVEAGIVDIDPSFDALDQHAIAYRWVQHTHHLHARDLARELLARSATPLSGGAEAALVVPTSWSERRAVEYDLRRSGVGENEARTATFVLAYLSGNTADLDYLTEAPAPVDPGEEIKPAIARHLIDLQMRALPARGNWDAMTAMLGPQDRIVAAAARAAALAPGANESVPWYIDTDRAELTRQVSGYRDQLDFAIAIGGRLSSSTSVAVDDLRLATEVFEDLLDRRREIDAVVGDLTETNTLLEIENTRLLHVLDGLDHGHTRVDGLFVGELAMRATDLQRSAARGDRLAAAGAEAITAALHSVSLPGKTAAAAGVPDQQVTYQTLQRLSLGSTEGPQDAAELRTAVEAYLVQVGLARPADAAARAASSAEPGRAAALANSAEVNGDSRVPDELSESLAIVVRDELDYRISLAEHQGRGHMAREVAWSSRITEVCAARDAGTVEFAPDVLAAPLGQVTTAAHIQRTDSLILDALGGVDRTVHDPATTEADPQPSTGPDAQVTAEL
ncbi:MULTISPECIES: hypothetical protein [Nocardia]|uniref:hypothetical protein n=1 Tax=Nocardia TaxID=1817 RepID=UPI0013008F48|nr:MULTISPECIES: hypothetical protein [Nocardia]